MLGHENNKKIFLYARLAASHSANFPKSQSGSTKTDRGDRQGGMTVLARPISRWLKGYKLYVHDVIQ